MPYQVTLRQDQLCDIVKHLEHVRAYYAAEASAMSQAVNARTWDSRYTEYALSVIAERMEQIHNADALWEYLLESRPSHKKVV